MSNDFRSISSKHMTVSTISQQEVRTFLSANSYSTAFRFSLAKGLFHRGAIVSVMLFEYASDPCAQWEVVFCASSRGVVITGGAGKLFNSFLNDRKPDTILFTFTSQSDKDLAYSLGFRPLNGTTLLWSSKIDGIIYRITNSLNNHTYIGLSKKSTDERWRGHLSGSKYPVDKAIKKYGKENFVYEVIDTATDCYTLAEKEREWIAKCSPEYNILSGGYQLYSSVRTEESRQRMREAAKHRPPISQETRRKMSAAHKGRNISPEQAKILRDFNTGKSWYTDGVHNIKSADCPAGFRKGITRKSCTKQ